MGKKLTELWFAQFFLRALTITVQTRPAGLSG